MGIGTEEVCDAELEEAEDEIAELKVDVVDEAEELEAVSDVSWAVVTELEELVVTDVDEAVSEVADGILLDGVVGEVGDETAELETVTEVSEAVVAGLEVDTEGDGDATELVVTDIDVAVSEVAGEILVDEVDGEMGVAGEAEDSDTDEIPGVELVEDVEVT